MYIQNRMIIPIISPINAASLNENDIKIHANINKIGALMIELAEIIPLSIS